MVNIGLILSAIAIIIFVTQFKGIDKTQEAIKQAKDLATLGKSELEKLRKTDVSTGTADRPVEDQ